MDRAPSDSSLAGMINSIDCVIFLPSWHFQSCLALPYSILWLKLIVTRMGRFPFGRWLEKFLPFGLCVTKLVEPQRVTSPSQSERKISANPSGNRVVVIHISLFSEGKAIPVQAWTSPEGYGRLRLPDFKAIDKRKKVSLSALRTGCIYHPRTIC
jgi:hypothetical protein